MIQGSFYHSFCYHLCHHHLFILIVFSILQIFNKTSLSSLADSQSDWPEIFGYAPYCQRLSSTFCRNQVEESFANYRDSLRTQGTCDMNASKDLRFVLQLMIKFQNFPLGMHHHVGLISKCSGNLQSNMGQPLVPNDQAFNAEWIQQQQSLYLLDSVQLMAGSRIASWPCWHIGHRRGILQFGFLIQG